MSNKPLSETTAVRSPGVEEVLTRAADLYEHEGVEFAQAVWGHATPGGAACLTEVVATAARQVGWRFKWPGPSGCTCGQCVGDEAAQIAGFFDAEDAWRFNDEKGRTKAEVIDWLRMEAREKCFGFRSLATQATASQSAPQKDAAK